MASDAVGLERISKIVGYKITKGDYRNTSPNLPQRIAIIGEANTANQAGLDTDPMILTSAQKAGELYGFGSPIYNVMRILRPNNGSEGVGGIPTVVYPQAAAGGSAAKAMTVTPVGSATKNGTHTLKISGRSGLDGVFYDINIVTGDTVATTSVKIAAAINAVLGCPVSAVSSATEATATAKWTGLTSQEISIEVDLNDTDLGITYVVAQTVAGSGTPSIAASLALFGNDWNTIVVNTYGTVTAVMDSLEAVNGIPDPVSPTGKYAGIIFKPFIALTGSVVDDPSSITDARKLNVTIAICPAPLSLGFTAEAAANMCRLYARTSQDNPQLDVSGQYYPDMPTPETIGSMADYENRDLFVKKGCSTVELSSGQYRVMDFVTTYHPDGETPPQYRYCRNLNIDMNIRYGYYLLEQVNVVDHVIARDEDTVTASKVVKPKMWKSIIDSYATDLTKRALIVDELFTQQSITVDISSVNPDRLESFFKYKRSGYARIASTTAEAGFNFGNV
jgi:phage tail sheath gpL-like